MTAACAVCGGTIEPDLDHVQLEVTKKRMRDRDELEEYYLHERCARNTIGSWETPG